MMATLFSLAGYLLHIVSMTALSYLVFRGATSAFPLRGVKDLDPFVLSISIFLPLALRNFPWLAVMSEFPSTLPSCVSDMIASLHGLVGYLVCMTGLSFLVFFIAFLVCHAGYKAVWRHPANEFPDWVFNMNVGVAVATIDMFMEPSSISNIMPPLISLAGYLLYIVCITVLPFLAFKSMYTAFPSLDYPSLTGIWITILLPLALKNFLWLGLISEFPVSLPSNVSQMLATIVGLAVYFVCMTVLSFVVLGIATINCEVASHPIPENETIPDWIQLIGLGTTALVMDVFMKHSSHSSMMAMIILVAGLLAHIMCMPALSYLVFRCAMSAFPMLEKFYIILAPFTIFLLLALKNIWCLSLFPESPPSIFEMIATLLGLCGYLLCMTGLSFLVFLIANLIFFDIRFNWMIDMITFGISFVVMDMFMKHSSHSKMMAMLLFAGYLVYILCMMGLSYLTFKTLVFDNTSGGVLPSLLPVPLINYQWSVPMMVAGVILVLNDTRGVTPVEKPAFISEFLCTLPFFDFTHDPDTLLGYLVYNLFVVALWFLAYIIARGATRKIMIRWPMYRPELVFRTIIGLTIILFTMMWGKPVEEPFIIDSEMEAILANVLYIMCSMALARLLKKSMMDGFAISLTSVLLDMVGFSDIIDGLFWMIATSVLAFFFLVALSFLLSMVLHRSVTLLLPFAMNNYRELTFASIVGLNFKMMKTMLDTPAVEKLSILSNTKSTLLGIADLGNHYHVVYLVIRYLTVLALPWLLMESRYMKSKYMLHGTAAVIIALGLVLTMPPSTPMPIQDLALQPMVLGDIISRMVMSFVTHTILILVTLIGGMVFYVRHQYPSWKSIITTRSKGFIEHAGLEASNYINDLVYKCTNGWFGKK